MWQHAWFLAFADFKIMLRRRETWLWTFVLPVVFSYFIGTITARFRDTGTTETIGVYVPGDAGFLADHLLTRLQKTGYTLERVSDRPALERFDRRLAVPDGFTASVLAGKAVRVEFTRKEAAAMEADIQAMAADPDIQREIRALGDGLPAREPDGVVSPP